MSDHDEFTLMYPSGRRPDRGPTEADWFEAHLTNLGHEIVRALHVRQMVVGLDRLLRRWPWLYRRLGG